MKDLNPEQKAAVESDGNVVVTACPGSGKTRVLAARVVRGVCELESSRERVVGSNVHQSSGRRDPVPS